MQNILFTKAELRDGDLILFSNGSEGIYFSEFGIITKTVTLPESWFNSDLTASTCRGINIDMVKRVIDGKVGFGRVHSTDGVKTVFERDNITIYLSQEELKDIIGYDVVIVKKG